MHAKIFIADRAATVGSSNFTRPGLDDQIEVNARYEARGERRRYAELTDIAENIWSAASPFDDELKSLLEALLRVVDWREALARAVAELLEGEWATRYIPGPHTSDGLLWPSQRAGIAQALWVINEVGSVLIADATGSGKTRMGAHLTQAVRNRLWRTGRVRRDVVVLVCPPAVENIWMREALIAGTPLLTRSHGKLSRHGTDNNGDEALAMRAAQILAVDEAHNFLNSQTNRTRLLQGNHADHVMLLTATPINRGAPDILQLVNLLGADNFDDEALKLLSRLRPRGRRGAPALTADEAKLLRNEIGRFTVRRTKNDLNAMVDRDPDSYRHPTTQRVARYPEHITHTYRTGESARDKKTARKIRALTEELVGISLFEGQLEVPETTRIDHPTLTDDAYLEYRLNAIRNLASYIVLDTLRSSRAALIEHLSGTDAAIRHFDLPAGFKGTATGNMLDRLDEFARRGPPDIQLNCPVPDWLTDHDQWIERCKIEHHLYRRILAHACYLSPAREQAKAALIERRTHDHERVLAFDKHPITLFHLQQRLLDQGIHSLIATGSSPATRSKLKKRLAPDATGRTIALCSDALNETMNFQGASAVVHLDLPTTLRSAEQRVGRSARMDSPHDSIEIWWPDDSEDFATRANQLIARRAHESAQLLGSNLDIPQFDGTDRVITIHEYLEEYEHRTANIETWHHLQDVFEPIRRLVEPPEPMIDPNLYEQLRHIRHRVLAHISPLHAPRPWVFLSIAGSNDGAPRWLFLDGPKLAPIIEFDKICDRLRTELASGPEAHRLDAPALALLDRALTIAGKFEYNELLPRRMRRALDQMQYVITVWISRARTKGDMQHVDYYQQLADLTRPASDSCQETYAAVDPYLVAERWYYLVTPVLTAHRRNHRREPFLLLDQITSKLVEHPFPDEALAEAFSELPELTPLAERVTACLLGITPERHS